MEFEVRFVQSADDDVGFYAAHERRLLLVRDNSVVRVLAVGHKEHNDLYIRGRKVGI